MTVATALTGLAANLDTIDGLRVTEYVPDSPNLPAAWIVPPTINYHEAMQKGLRKLSLEVIVFVTAASGDRARSVSMIPYTEVDGATSVATAIMSDPTLGGAASDTFVNVGRPLGYEEVAAYQMWGYSWDVLVLLP